MTDTNSPIAVTDVPFDVWRDISSEAANIFAFETIIDGVHFFATVVYETCRMPGDPDVATWYVSRNGWEDTAIFMAETPTVADAFIQANKALETIVWLRKNVARYGAFSTHHDSLIYDGPDED